MTSSGSKTSGIWDNHHRGTIGDFLKEKILQGSDLSFVSAYFTIYAYSALKEQLDQINHLRFLFGEATIQSNHLTLTKQRKRLLGLRMTPFCYQIDLGRNEWQKNVQIG